MNVLSEGLITAADADRQPPPPTIPLKVDGQESNFPKASDSFSSLSPRRPSSQRQLIESGLSRQSV